MNTDDTKAPRPKHTVAEKVQRDEKQTVKLDEKDIGIHIRWPRRFLSFRC
jgi:hypothetical protein